MPAADHRRLETPRGAPREEAVRLREGGEQHQGVAEGLQVGSERPGEAFEEVRCAPGGIPEVARRAAVEGGVAEHDVEAPTVKRPEQIAPRTRNTVPATVEHDVEAGAAAPGGG